MSSNSVSILVPVIGDQPIDDRVWDNMALHARKDCPVWLYANRPAERALAGNIHWTQGYWGSLAELLNQAFREMSSQVVVFLPPHVMLDPEAPQIIQHALSENRKYGYAYSDFRYSDGREIRLIDDPGDITERQDWGDVFAVRRDMVLQKGGVDEANPTAVFYDLRLKMSDQAPLMHIPQALYDVPAPSMADMDVGKDVLFFPGQGKYGGFSYLFNDPEVEKQFERVFYSMLRRRGAYLERIPPVTPPDSGPPPSPAVSVLIPVYNRQDFIGKAIKSVLNGTFCDFEVLVIDNGSTDGTCAKVEEYAKDTRIRLIHCPENIIAKSLNTGVKAARGRYLAQLDSDDEYTKDTLSRMVAHLDDHPTCGLAISYYELMDMAGNTMKDFGIITHSEYNVNNILRVDGAGAVRVWRASVLKNLGGFDEKELGGYGEDYDLVLKVSERYEVGRVHEVLYRYRRHPGNTDAMIDGYRKIRAKSRARQNALQRRRQLNRDISKLS
jgi:hypothetical protein